MSQDVEERERNNDPTAAHRDDLSSDRSVASR